ncbi:hypothetical protein BS333_17420 [Vibrio azureus]|uniref:Uncharacterized protein n=1 Tax=Vibrio azureus NBRC 104587 TaxID=1219077 RepID=U3ANU1_9VIBR|nr:hypothetical protein [Vibrio azureus]AUI88139.1 hypothetical protein BS333_17420 [Vibrio azureus]GAD74967.1 hypothetical protein VAZ01S_017_00620 [Vibrio azureus NBRC 104587]
MEKVQDELAEIEQEIGEKLQTAQAALEQAKANKSPMVQVETDTLEILFELYAPHQQYINIYSPEYIALFSDD